MYKKNIPANLRNFCVSGGSAAEADDTDTTEFSRVRVPALVLD